jgi:hypothetical protein
MTTADMIADNPGTWLFHCHVSDHMENGMMATYTIYPPPRSCPVSIAPEEWDRVAASSSVRIRNVGAKPIRKVSLLSGYLVSTLELQPLMQAWFSEQPLQPGQEQTVPVGSEMFANQSYSGLGVAFYPSWIVYEDGTDWKPYQLGDCFQVYWRSKDHPHPPVLPPFQLTTQED